MLCRNAVRALCLLFVFPIQVSSRKCVVCKKNGTAENMYDCTLNPDFLAPPCPSPHAWCAIFRDKKVFEHGTAPFVVSQRCTVEGEIPPDLEKDKFCGQVDGMEMCACNKDKCNKEKTCMCETKPKEEKPTEAGSTEPVIIDTIGPTSVEPEETATSKPTKPPGKISRTKKPKSKSTKVTGTKKPKSTKPTETKKPKPTKPTGIKEPKSTELSKTAKQTAESTSGPKQVEPQKPEKADNQSNMVVVGWENVFVCACVFVFQFLY